MEVGIKENLTRWIERKEAWTIKKNKHENMKYMLKRLMREVVK